MSDVNVNVLRCVRDRPRVLRVFTCLLHACTPVLVASRSWSLVPVPSTIELSGSDTELDLGQNTELDQGAQELDNEVYTCQLP